MQGGNKVESLQLTNEPHPYPQLRSLQREILQYTRADGVALNAELFLPPHYDPAKHGPLPCILWAYPRCASRHCCADALPCSWLACCCARRQSPAVASEHGVRLVRALHAWATACGARASSEPVCACPAEHEWHMCREFKSKALAPHRRLCGLRAATQSCRGHPCQSSRSAMRSPTTLTCSSSWVRSLHAL
jgi:hypothetical protein